MDVVNFGNISVSIGKKIGEGAFGEVFVVYDNNNKTQKYALKKITCTQNEELANVKNEISSLALLDHENIIRMHDTPVVQYEEFTATFSLLLEYCANGNLSERLSSPSSKALNVRWMKMITSAVEYLHNKHIIHRDLKPDNILLADGDVLKITDFGMARRFREKEDTEQTWLDYYMTDGGGAVCYVAPEMFLGEHTYKVDIFSMGIVFFAILERKNMELDGITCYGCFVKDEIGELLPLGIHMHNEGHDVEIPFSRKGIKREEIRKLLHYDPNERPKANEVMEFFNNYRQRHFGVRASSERR